VEPCGCRRRESAGDRNRLREARRSSLAHLCRNARRREGCELLDQRTMNATRGPERSATKGPRSASPPPHSRRAAGVPSRNGMPRSRTDESERGPAERGFGEVRDTIDSKSTATIGLSKREMPGEHERRRALGPSRPSPRGTPEWTTPSPASRPVALWRGERRQNRRLCICAVRQRSSGRTGTSGISGRSGRSGSNVSGTMVQFVTFRERLPARRHGSLRPRRWGEAPETAPDLERRDLPKRTFWEGPTCSANVVLVSGKAPAAAPSSRSPARRPVSRGRKSGLRRSGGSLAGAPTF
jgi:hypothetical protein